jgi:Icc-related predicted phosphoesterase
MIGRTVPEYVTDVHLRFVQHRNWLIGGFGGVPSYKGSGAYERDDLAIAEKLSKFPYVDIFICHAPLLGITDKEDYAHQESKAIRRYIDAQQPKFVYHGHVHIDARWWGRRLLLRAGPKSSPDLHPTISGLRSRERFHL